MAKAAPRLDPAAVLAAWTERDLTADAARGELAPAFEIEPLLEQISELIEAGRHPLLGGEPGVGKTAAVYELARRAQAGGGPAALAGRRVLQFSLRQRLAGLSKPERLRPEMQRLVDALVASPDVVPFFRDLHLAYAHDLEPQILALALRGAGPILGEGERATLAAMLEMSPELGEHYALLDVDEPRVEAALRIVEQWSRGDARRHGRTFAPEALAEAVQLGHRFLPRARLPRKALDLLSQAAALAGGPSVTAEHVIERFCRTQRVPRFLIDPGVRLDLAQVEAHFSASMLGQHDAVEAVLRMVALIKSGLSDVRRPFGVFLFVGPTGVGKTHLAQLLAEFLFGSRERMLRLNMADFQKPADAATLFGDPEAWPPPRRRGQLTLRLLGQPFAVLLLDEFEKAHPTVHDHLLQLMDEGSFINGAGELVSCRSTIVIATSNEGAEVYRGRSLGLVDSHDLKSLDREVDRRLLQRFRFEFLNRFDQVVHFHPLTRDEIRAIARRELALLCERPGVRRHGLRVETDESVVDWLALNGYDPHYGARVLRRTLERHVATELARAMVERGLREGTSLLVTVARNRPVVRVVDQGPAPRRRESVAFGAGPTPRVRTLDLPALRAESERVLGAARARLERLETRRRERAALLDELNSGGAREATPEGYRAFERFRELDLAVSSDERLARPLRELAEAHVAETAEPARLARALEASARALEEWHRRDAEDGPAGLWLVVSRLDALRSAGTWITELARLELSWCRRLGLQAAVAAYDPGPEGPELVALDVEGPGAAALLVLETGVHRLVRGRGGSQRARVDLVLRQPESGGAEPKVSPARRRAGLFGDTLTCRGRLEAERLGRTLDLAGGDAATLRQLLHDLRQGWGPSDAGAETLARVYGEGGCGARDPRTGAIVPRLKDALRGQLDALLDAWRRAPQA